MSLKILESDDLILTREEYERLRPLYTADLRRAYSGDTETQRLPTFTEWVRQYYAEQRAAYDAHGAQG